MEDKFRIICKECSNDRRNEFQSTVNLIEELEKAQHGVSNNKVVYVKVPFTECIMPIYNEEIDKTFFFLDNPTDLNGFEVEHMWLILGDVNFEQRTVCGVLINEPVMYPQFFEQIIVAKFDDIEGIEWG